MVNGTKSDADTQKAEAKVSETPHAEKVIVPPSSLEVPAEKPAEAEPAPAAEKEEPAAPAEENPASEDSAVIDAVADQAGANKKKDGELSAEEKKHQEEIQKLIEDKKYFVPINVASKKRNARWSVVILVLLLLAAGGYLVVDAGLAGKGIKLPVELIKN